MFSDDFPTTLPEFEKRFSTDEACREYLYRLKWPDGFICPRCGNIEFWWTSKSKLHCTACGHQASVTVGTVLENTKKPLTLWFMAIFLTAFQKSGINAVNLQNLLGLGSYATAWTWLQKIRRSMVCKDREKLGEENGEVQVDEAYIGGKKEGKRGRGAEGKVPVAVAVEVNNPTGIGRIRMNVINNCGACELGNFLMDNVETGSVVISDNWRGYNLIELAGYTRNVVENVNKDLKCVHLVISLFKRWLLGTLQGGVGVGHLQKYMDEFVFRFNRRTSKLRAKVFHRLLEQVVATVASTYDQIVGRKRKVTT